MSDGGATSAPVRVATLLALAWPVIVSRITQTIIGMADAVMIAPLGEDALAATTTGALNVVNFLILPMGVVFIVQTYAAQLTGKGDPGGARRYAWYGIAIALVAELACVASVPFLAAGAEQLAYTPQVRVLLVDYMQLRLVSTGAAVGVEALGAYYGGLGNTQIGMRVNVVAMVLNVGLNWVLIYGHLGFPELGVRGAAIASAVATTLAFAGFFALFLFGKGGAARRMTGALSVREAARMMKVGLPSGLNWFFELLAFSFFVNVVVAGLGTTALASMMSVLQISTFSFMPAFGLSSAAAILVGQAIGAGRKDDVWPILRLALFVACGWMGFVGLVCLAIPGVLLAPFVADATTGAGFLLVATRMLRLSAAWQLFDAAAIAVSEVLRAAGDTAFAMWARTILAWAIFAPGSYYSVRVLGGGDLVAVGWVVGYLAALAVVMGWRFSTGKWRAIDLHEHPVD